MPIIFDISLVCIIKDIEYNLDLIEMILLKMILHQVLNKMLKTFYKTNPRNSKKGALKLKSAGGNVHKK